jgi:Rrf2 family protein
MIAVPRSTDYAVRIALHLACQDADTLVPLAELASARRLPLPFVRRIAAQLAEAGIVRSVRGPRGGITLARLASEVTLLDVVVAMEGPLCASDCQEAPEGCPFGRTCPVRDVWSSTTGVLENHLRQSRLSDLAAAEAHRAAHRKTSPPLRAASLPRT